MASVLENVEYYFIIITLKSTLIQSGSICWVPSMGQIELFNHLSVWKQMTELVFN